MKKIFLFVIVTLLCLQITVSAQKSRVGIVAGITSANFSGKLGGVDIDYNSRAGYTVGLIVDAPLGKSNFSFQPGLHYIQRGAETFEDKDHLDFTALRYIELQGNFLYNAGGENGGTTFFVGAGPTFAAALPSKTVAINTKTDTRVETNITLGKRTESSAQFTTIDYGANLLAGFRLKKNFMVSFNYTIGVANILPDSPIPANINDKINNTTFGVRIGFLVNNAKN